jgi:signal transduction histidine kinase
LKHGSGIIRVTAEIEGNRLGIGVSNAAITADTTDAGGIGLKNIASRAAELDGSAEARLQDGRFVVSIKVPLPREQA